MNIRRNLTLWFKLAQVFVALAWFTFLLLVAIGVFKRSDSSDVGEVRQYFMVPRNWGTPTCEHDNCDTAQEAEI